MIDPLNVEQIRAEAFARMKEQYRTNDPLTPASPVAWEAYGYVIPTVGSLAEAKALKAKGEPCYVPFLGRMRFSAFLAVETRQEPIPVTQEDIDLQKELLEEQEYWLNTPNRLKSVTDMLKTPEIDWIVEDKIHASGLFQLFGASYTGKTLLILDLVMSWCAGLTEWQGYRLNTEGQPQQALYVAAEGGAALSVHVDAWLKHHKDVDPSRLSGLVFLDGGEGDNVFLSVNSKRSRDDTPDVEAADSWNRLHKEVIDKGLSPTLVVFDTQIDLAPGVDENSNTDMVDILRQVKRLGDTYGFMAVVIHHTGHNGDKARGASGMMGKADAQAKLSGIGENTGKAKLEWIKVKGRAKPQDTISYEIQGTKQLPGLNSEGAVCVPMGRHATRVAILNANKPDDETVRKIMQAVSTQPLSGRGIAEAMGVDRGNAKLKDAIDWMVHSVMLKREGEGRNTKYTLADFAVVPEDPEYS